MLNRLIRRLTNLLYFVRFQVKWYETNHPDSEVLIADATKAKKMDGNTEIRYEANWMVAKRAVLMLTPSKLVCGNWEIPLSEVEEATLLKVRQLLVTGYVLKVATSEAHYQFGFQYNPAWEQQEHLPVEVKKGKIKYSVFSIIVRLILLAWLVQFALQQFH